MSGIKIFLGGYSLLNSLQQTTVVSLMKCSISSTSTTNKTKERLHQTYEESADTSGVKNYLRSNSIQFAQGWNNLNILNCPKADHGQFYIDKNNGRHLR